MKSKKLLQSLNKSIFSLVFVSGTTMLLAACQGGSQLGQLSNSTATSTNAQLATDKNSRSGIKSGGSKENLASLSEAVRANKDADAYNIRATAHARAGNYNAALKDLNAAIQLNPSYVPAYANRAKLYYKQKRLDLALQDYNRALQIAPNYYMAHVGRARVYRTRKQYHEAVASLEHAINLRPDEPLAYYDRGLVRQILGQHPEAVTDFDVAISLKPASSEPYFSRGRSRMVLRQFKEAYGDFGSAVKNKKGNFKAWYFRGLAAEQAGDRNKAARAFRRALSINDNFGPAHKALSRVS